jgi:hypothetical protein
MDQIHLSPLVDQIQLTLGHISNIMYIMFTLTMSYAHNFDPDNELCG